MILSHAGKAPKIDPSAVLAPTATICGDVTIGPNCRIMHGAAVVAEALGSHRADSILARDSV
jgi:carbonic anhydrase/acetyltransferase-like protein (isoleucine patch superfamily)